MCINNKLCQSHNHTLHRPLQKLVRRWVGELGIQGQVVAFEAEALLPI